MKQFKELGLNADIMKSLDDLGFVEPTPVQEKTIPFILNSEQDLTALAQTGTGKTAAFSLPILHKMKADGRTLQAIVLCPTRELCIQSAQGIKEFAKYSKGVNVTPVYGGERIDVQIRALKRGTNIVVGTPGRVCDLIRRGVLKLQTIKWVVLDEADEMLDMGFKEDLDSILDQTPKERQTLLFSATMSKSVSSIAGRYMKDAEEISVGDKNIGADTVSHEYYVVNSRDKFEALKRILDCLPNIYGILFCRTKRETQEIADKLRQANYDVEAIHGDVSQNIRTKIMDRFKKKQIRILVATDVAARGIDVKDLTHVINYNLPDQNISYTHRSGRTGRAHQEGVSVAIVTPRDVRQIKELERIIGQPFELKQVPKGEEVYKRQIDNFIDTIKHPDTKMNIDDKYVEDVIKRLKAVKKEELIKHFVTKELTHLANGNSNTRDLNAIARPVRERKLMTVGDSVNLKINIGRKQKLDIKGVFALFNTNKKLRGIEIGKIDLMPGNTIFAIEKKRADEVIRVLTGTKFRGDKIVVTRSEGYFKPNNFRGGGNNRGRNSRGNSRGGYRGKDRRR